jgi:hypothetical protein
MRTEIRGTEIRRRRREIKRIETTTTTKLDKGIGKGRRRGRKRG